MTAKVNLIVDQGSTFSQELLLYDDNDDVLIVTALNDDPLYTANAKMRKSYQAINSVSFDTALSNGMLVLSLTSNATTDIAGGRYVYDVELTSTSGVPTTTRVVEGIVTVKPEATR